MTSLRIHEGVWGTITATSRGVVIHVAANADTALAVDADRCILLEQGFATEESDGTVVPWDNWGLAVWYKVRTLTAFTQPSHLLLEVDRYSEIGQRDFAYVLRWREAAREVAVERVGAYVRHTASGRVMHMDGHTLALVEAMERFNALSPDDRRRPDAAWGALATVHREAAATGAILDGYLRSNTVIVPSSIGLTIHQHDDGAITFLPRIPEYDSAQFAAAFDMQLGVPDMYVLTDTSRSDGRRVRILFSEQQRDVLRRMKQVQRLRGDAVRSLIAEPLQVFDGVADAIDLTDVPMQYGPRVIGVGGSEQPSESQLKRGSTILEQIGAQSSGEAGDGAEPLGDSAEEPSSKPSQLVALDVVDARTGQTITLRLTESGALEDLCSTVQQALARGESIAAYGGHEIVVEEALRIVLERYLQTPAGSEDRDAGQSGQSGHLYLLINEHEDSLTEAFQVSDEPAVAPSLAEARAPVSLLPSITLQPHQRQGLHWLATCRGIETRRGAILADDMGLGKTLQLLAHIATLIESDALLDEPTNGPNGPWRPVLIVAPLLLVDTRVWVEEMQNRFVERGRVFEPLLILRDEGIRKVTRAGGGRDLLGKPLLDPEKLMAHKVVITTYETLMAYQHSLAQWIGGRPLWSLVIFDEAQEIKAPKAKQSIAAKAVDARFKVAATGTPVETRLLDLWNLLDNVEPNLIGTQRDFVARYERPVMNASEPAVRDNALAALRVQLRYQQPSAVLLRRDKSILHDLPSRTEHRLACVLTDSEREVLHGVIAANRRRTGKGSALAMLQRLHLVSQHPILAGGRGDLTDAEGLIRDSSRLQALISVLRKVESQGEKALVFARSVDAQRILAFVIGRTFSRPVAVINGSTGTDAARGQSAGTVRRKLLDQFRQEPGFGVIVLSPFVAGVGITLTEANHVIHYGRWWNPAIESQATDRVYRIGQSRPVHVYYPISVDPTNEGDQTLDQAIDALLTERRALAGDFLTPASEEAAADLLVRRLTDITARSTSSHRDAASTGMTAGPVQCPVRTEQVAGILSAMAAARGERVVWLGPEGLFGVQALRAARDGALTCYRIVSSADTDANANTAVALSAQQAWSQKLGGRDVAAVLLSERSLRTDTLRSKTWTELIAEATAAGVTDAARWTLLTTYSTLDAVRNALSPVESSDRH